MILRKKYIFPKKITWKLFKTISDLRNEFYAIFYPRINLFMTILVSDGVVRGRQSLRQVNIQYCQNGQLYLNDKILHLHIFYRFKHFYRVFKTHLQVFGYKDFDFDTKKFKRQNFSLSLSFHTQSEISHKVEYKSFTQ